MGPVAGGCPDVAPFAGGGAPGAPWFDDGADCCPDAPLAGDDGLPAPGDGADGCPAGSFGNCTDLSPDALFDESLGGFPAEVGAPCVLAGLAAGGDGGFPGLDVAGAAGVFAVGGLRDEAGGRFDTAGVGAFGDLVAGGGFAGTGAGDDLLPLDARFTKCRALTTKKKQLSHGNEK